MIAIIDYGMGNLASVYNAFNKVGATDIKITSDPDEISKADKLVLPGVGAFEDAMKNLKAGNLIIPILESVDMGKPFLGICLGFQLVFEKSYENGVFEGLGIFKGEVVRFNIDEPVPHIGWNEAEFCKVSPLSDGLSGSVYFYFDHSYYPVPKDKDIICAVTGYETKFASVINRDNIYAVQFHPEKSHTNGLKIIANFAELGTIL
jgi:glutamine amidotransferase